MEAKGTVLTPKVPGTEGAGQAEAPNVQPERKRVVL